jgi:hypothetical protein
MTDKEISALLGTSSVGDDAVFRLKVIEGIHVRRQRAAARRRLLVFTCVFALVGLTIGLLGQRAWRKWAIFLRRVERTATLIPANP